MNYLVNSDRKCARCYFSGSVCYRCFFIQQKILATIAGISATTLGLNLFYLNFKLIKSLSALLAENSWTNTSVSDLPSNTGSCGPLIGSNQ